MVANPNLTNSPLLLLNQPLLLTTIFYLTEGGINTPVDHIG